MATSAVGCQRAAAGAHRDIAGIRTEYSGNTGAGTGGRRHGWVGHLDDRAAGAERRQIVDDAKVADRHRIRIGDRDGQRPRRAAQNGGAIAEGLGDGRPGHGGDIDALADIADVGHGAAIVARHGAGDDGIRIGRASAVGRTRGHRNANRATAIGGAAGITAGNHAAIERNRLGAHRGGQRSRSRRRGTGVGIEAGIGRRAGDLQAIRQDAGQAVAEGNAVDGGRRIIVGEGNLDDGRFARSDAGRLTGLQGHRSRQAGPGRSCSESAHKHRKEFCRMRGHANFHRP